MEQTASDSGVIGFSLRFLLSEWENVIDAWHIDSVDSYADVPRMGRKNRLGAKQRETLWEVFARIRGALRQRALFNSAALFQNVTATYAARDQKPFTHIVVDEAHDLGVSELRFLAAIAPDTTATIEPPNKAAIDSTAVRASKMKPGAHDTAIDMPMAHVRPNSRPAAICPAISLDGQWNTITR